MIETLYSLGALDTSRALLLALLVGFGFGFGLERAGFSSSRRLAGVTLIEAEKDLFAAIPTGAIAVGRRVVAELPAGYARRGQSSPASSSARA